MKRLFLLLALGLSPLAHATDLTVSCQPTLTNTDGSTIDPAVTPITFNLYGALQGVTPQLLTPAALPQCSSVRTNVNPGTQCYTWTEVVSGQESAQATPLVCSVVPPVTAPKPSPPTNVTVTPVTVATTVYMELQVPNGFGFLAVGTIPLGSPCDPAQRVNNFNVVPRELVTWTGKIQRLAVVAACSIS